MRARLRLARTSSGCFAWQHAVQAHQYDGWTIRICPLWASRPLADRALFASQCAAHGARGAVSAFGNDRSRGMMRPDRPAASSRGVSPRTPHRLVAGSGAGQVPPGLSGRLADAIAASPNNTEVRSDLRCALILRAFASVTPHLLRWLAVLSLAAIDVRSLRPEHSGCERPRLASASYKAGRNTALFLRRGSSV